MASTSANPVAMMVTLSSSSILKSWVVPKMISASWCTTCFMVCDILFTSAIMRSAPPVMFSSTPVAPLMFTSSSGDPSTAAMATFARSMPFPLPIAIQAGPASRITVRRSAKSRFISPGSISSSVIDCMAWRSTSSANLKAMSMDIDGSATRSSLSFGITIMVSTSCASLLSPFCASNCRWYPSKGNGLVTTPTVKHPRSCFAILATTGAPPVPVPPPMPAAMNARSVSASTSRISSLLSSKHTVPSAGLPPTPMPPAMRSPTLSLREASALASACASVFATMYSTPGIRLRYIRVTALEPPPPMPMTFMFTDGVRLGCVVIASDSVNVVILRVL